MKAIQVHEFGSPETVIKLEEIPNPQPNETQVKVKVRAAGLNPADVIAITGNFQITPVLPLIPGFEAAGEIIELGRKVSEFQVGDKVLVALPYSTPDGVRFGAMAEELVAPAANIVKMPDNLDFACAAKACVAYGTAYISLQHCGRLKSGETLLINGGTGSVGSAGVEVGKRLGAKVIATAGGAEKCQKVTSRGADYAIDYKSEDIAQRVLELTDGKGADVILDTVGGDAFDASLNCINFEGRILAVGAASGKIPTVNILDLLSRNCSVIGVDFAAYTLKDTATVKQALTELMTWYSEGAIKPEKPNAVNLEQAAKALGKIEKGSANGKFALVMD
ncbi:Zn-dependent oxidoreductase, NADPH:quinone reductase [Rivularia sp. PCC 7116]|uniref:NADPH:quinone oxidoreductase family protein n=1 Tax=Rivularia sp. PCC 7116 TaxID=373994 RepID=UPI00029EFF60|nr:NADPH:quinone oxidoreductase family protein [Rivularia sp. PCC 7116]AFY57988.1 Zn-dependent oxidoreductase, NADPH:quinone reductase [Rivularia sp. PCC 7116]